MTFILSEDESLKAYLQNVVRVSDTGDGSRPVPVYFGMPEKELRALTYPAILIELIDVAEATERVHRGTAGELTYTPEGFPALNADQKLRLQLPQPFDLTYQITTLARHPRHDRQMLAGLNAGALGVRGGGLPVEDDKTIRRLDRLGFVKRDTADENGKRVFRNVFTYRVSAELWPSTIGAIRRVVERVFINAEDTPQPPPDFTKVGVEVQYP